MTRDEFLSQLIRELSDLPPAEVAEACRYYREYLDEAGPDGEAQALAALGSPADIAAQIRAGSRQGAGTPPEAPSAAPPPVYAPRRRWTTVLIAVLVVGAIVFQLVRFIGPRFLWSDDGERRLSQSGGGQASIPSDSIESPEAPETPTAPETPADGEHGFPGAALKGSNQETYVLTDFSELEIEAVSADISIQTGGEEYRLDISWDNDRLRPEYTQRGSVLRVTQKAHAGISLSGSSSIVVTIPWGADLNEIDCETVSGLIDVSLPSADQVDLSSVSGDITLSAAVWECDAETVSGDISLSPGSFDKLSLESVSGNIDVQSSVARSDCAFELETMSGKITLNGEKQGKRLETGGGPCSVDAETVSGDIAIALDMK